jgi:hypothetical protein
MAASQFAPDVFSRRHRRRGFRAAGSNARFWEFATCLLQQASRNVSSQARGPMEYHCHRALL